MSKEFFDLAADALVGFLPQKYRGFSSRRTAINLKVLIGDVAAEHYEVQALRGGELEIGFHAEHSASDRNDEALAPLLAKEKTWRKALGKQAELGPFLGRQGKVWRRVSEVWPGPGLITPDVAIEAAERLAMYIRALEPLRRG